MRRSAPIFTLNRERVPLAFQAGHAGSIPVTRSTGQRPDGISAKSEMIFASPVPCPDVINATALAHVLLLTRYGVTMAWPPSIDASTRADHVGLEDCAKRHSARELLAGETFDPASRSES